MRNILFLFLAVTLIACSKTKETIRGEGTPVEEFLNLKGFDNIVFSGAGILKVRSETETHVLINEYPNLLEHLEAYVKNKVLYLGYSDNYRVENSVLEITVTAPSIKKVTSNGTGDLYVLGVQDGETMTATLNGAGKIDIQGSKFKDFYARLNGAGNLFISDSNCRTFDLKIEGVGNCSSFGMISNDAKVKINGAGSAEVAVVQTLDVEINGVGSLSYSGDPKVASKINGAGRVDKK